MTEDFRLWITAVAEKLPEELADVIHAEVEELDQDLYASTRDSCRSIVGMIMSLLREEVNPHDAVAPPETVFYACELARRDLGADLLIRAYRILHQALYAKWLEHLEGTTSNRARLAEETRSSSDWLFSSIDAVTNSAVEAYTEAREKRIRSVAAIRAEGVRAILEDRAVDQDEMSMRLNYELRREHLGFVIWSEQGHAPDLPAQALERIAKSLADEVGARSSLLVPQGHLRLDGWIALPPDTNAPLLDQRLEVAVKVGARVAIGLPAYGLEGFRQTFVDAMAAQRIAILANWPTGTCSSFGQLSLVSLLMSDLDAATRFIELELGELAADTDGARRIASTVRVYLEEQCSFTRAGRKLGIHQNTVNYRIRQATGLLGHDLRGRQLELQVALRLLDTLRRGAR